MDGFRWIPSPHCDDRPEGVGIDLMVAHAISLPPGEFGGGFVDAFFQGRLDPSGHPYFEEIAGMRVAAHFLVDREGRVAQYVPVMKRAWHAGESLWRGRERCNDFSVGVELEGAEGGPFEAVQYQRLAELFRTLQKRFPELKDDCIAGHEEIAPGRKWDPGPGFDWERFREILTSTGPRSDWPLIWEEAP